MPNPKIKGLAYLMAKKGVSRGEALDMLRAPDENSLAQMRTKKGDYVERPTGASVKDFKSFQNERLNRRNKAGFEVKKFMNTYDVNIQLPTKLRSKDARMQEKKDVKIVRRGTASNATEQEKLLAKSAIDKNKVGNTRRTFNNLLSYEAAMRRKYNSRMNK
jgi:hypothetical protein